MSPPGLQLSCHECVRYHRGAVYLFNPQRLKRRSNKVKAHTLYDALLDIFCCEIAWTDGPLIE